MKRDYDILVIGGGHAGAEAAWAASRLGASVALITLEVNKIGQMSCNPAIGGLAKGQMVREIDALGGLMGLATDNTGIQFRMLNRSKGPAVWGPRAQADKYKYAQEVQRLLRTCPNLDIVQGEVAEIETRIESLKHGHGNASANDSMIQSFNDSIPTVSAVLLSNGTRLTCRAAIVTTGTFLRGLMHTGERQTEGGRVGESAAKSLSPCLQKLGLELGRLKTGTPPRLDRRTIDFTRLELQPGDEVPAPFSYLNEYAGIKSLNHRTIEPLKHGHANAFANDSMVQSFNDSIPWSPPLPQLPCHLTATSREIHAIIRANLHRAPMYSGQIQVRRPALLPQHRGQSRAIRRQDQPPHFPGTRGPGHRRDLLQRHQHEPADRRAGADRASRPRFREGPKILRFGYAVEYDMVWPTQIRSTLETKMIAGIVPGRPDQRHQRL